MKPFVSKYYTEEEYLAFERASQDKHEYYDGMIFPLGEFPVIQDSEEDIYRHAIIIKNVKQALFIHQHKGRCFLDSAFTLTVKQDETVIADIIIALNSFNQPAVIIEILSPSAANYDRGAKFDLYREIESLQEYILIDSTRTHFVHYNRNADNTWTLYETKNREDNFFISTVEFTTSLAEIYAGSDIQA